MKHVQMLLEVLIYYIDLDTGSLEDKLSELLNICSTYVSKVY